MDPAGAYHDNAAMQDIGTHYDEVGQVGQGPYFNIPNLDLSLSNVLDHDMASIHLGGANGVSSSQAYGGDMSSEVVTPSRSKSAARAKKGRKAHVLSEEEDDDDEDEEDEEEEEEEEEEEDEDEDEEDDFDDEDEDDYDEPVVRKKHRPATKLKLKTPTPKARKGTGATPKSSARSRTSARRSAKVKEAIPFNRQRRAPKDGIMDSRPIPRSYDECDEADKALLDMRDEEKKTWKQIRAVWEELTGQKTGTSTLPNRYERLKDNFSIIRAEDRPKLLEAKDEVEAEMNKMKWKLIRDKVKQKGGGDYNPDHLQRQYKKMMVREGMRPPPGIVDADFEIAISDDNREDDEY